VEKIKNDSTVGKVKKRLYWWKAENWQVKRYELRQIVGFFINIWFYYTFTQKLINFIQWRIY